MTTPLQVKLFDHITIVVEDLDRSRDFYVGLLGMSEVPRPEFPFPGRWFQVGSTQIHLNVAGEEAGKAGPGSAGGTSRSRAFHHAFEVDSCDAAAEEFRRRGVNIITGPKDRPDGARQLYIEDPDGYLVEIYSRPPA